MPMSTDEEPTTPVSSPQGGVGSSFCPFHQAMSIVNSIVEDPASFDAQRLALEISLGALLGSTHPSALILPSAATSIAEEALLPHHSPPASSSGSNGGATASALGPRLVAPAHRAHPPVPSSDGGSSHTRSARAMEHQPAVASSSSAVDAGAPQSAMATTECCSIEEQRAFVLSAAFNCPDERVSEVVRAAVLEAATLSKTIDDSFLALLRQPDGNGGAWEALPPSLALPQLLHGDATRVMAGDPEHRALMARIFIETSECSNFSQILSLYPHLLRAQHAMWQFLFEGDGPLAPEERLLVAIVAAARHHCEYLTRKLMLRALLMPSFPRRWLYRAMPKKFVSFGKFLAKLAHRPWILKPSHIARLFADGDGDEGDGSDDDAGATDAHRSNASGNHSGDDVDHDADLEPWTVPSVVQAMCIATTVLADCGFVLLFHIPFEPSTAALPPELGGVGQVGVRHASTRNDEKHLLGEYPNYSGVPIHRFRTDSNMRYDSRIKRDGKEQHPSLQLSRFSWSINALQFIDSHYAGFAQLIEEENAMYVRATSVLDPTPMRFTGPDTVPETADDAFVWRSVTVYIHNLMGVTHADFNYAVINKVLSKEAKTFINKATTMPQDSVVEDFALAAKDASLYVVLALGAVCARREALLLHAMKNLEEFLQTW